MLSHTSTIIFGRPGSMKMAEKLAGDVGIMLVASLIETESEPSIDSLAM